MQSERDCAPAVKPAHIMTYMNKGMFSARPSRENTRKRFLLILARVVLLPRPDAEAYRLHQEVREWRMAAEVEPPVELNDPEHAADE